MIAVSASATSIWSGSAAIALESFATNLACHVTRDQGGMRWEEMRWDEMGGDQIRSRWNEERRALRQTWPAVVQVKSSQGKSSYDLRQGQG
jgi:hypothetical protein